MKDWNHALQKWATLLLSKAEDTYYNLRKYYILREIVTLPKNDPDVVTLHKTLIHGILDKQMENGSWNNKVYNYEEGTTHQVMKLVDLGVNINDDAIKKAVNYMFSFQRENGAFMQNEPSCGAEASLVVTNAVVMALARTGYADDPRVVKAYKWLCTWQQEDGSWLSPGAQSRREKGGYPYCYCGIHQTRNILLGLSTSETMRKSEAAARGVNYLLGLYGCKHTMTVTEAVEPPLYRYMEESLTPFEGTWHDPRIIPPEFGVISPEDIDRKVEVFTTQHVLGALLMLGYGLKNEKIKKGHDRLLELIRADEVSLETAMTIKGLHQPFNVFSFRGH